MPMTVLQGPAGSGKTHFCIERLRASLHSEGVGATILLAPAQSSYLLHEALEAGGPAAILGNPILSFDAHSASGSFAGWILRDAGGVAGKLLGKAEQLLILKRLLREHVDPVLRKSAETLGFSLEVSALFKEWKEALLSPGDLMPVFPAVSGPGARSAALRELYQRYQEHLAANSRQDAEDVQWRALQHVHSHPGAVAGVHFLVDGFSHFTQWQQEMLHALERHAASLTVTFPWEEGRPWVFQHQENDRARLTSGASRGVTVKSLAEQHRFRSPALAALERELFRESPRAAPAGDAAAGATAASPAAAADPSVEWAEAPGPLAEMQWIARRIRRLVQDEGIRPDDIAVMFRNLGAARRRLTEVFAAYGVPAFIDEREPALHTPPARAAVSVLRMTRASAGVDDALELFRSPLVPHLREDADLLESTALASGIQKAAALMEAAPAILGEASRLAAAAKALRPVLAGGGAPRPAKAWAGLIRSALEALGAERARRDSVELYLEHADAWQQLEDFLELLSAQDDAALALEGFVNSLSELLTSGLSGEVPRQGGRVLVADVFHSRLPEVRVLFLPCLNEGSFPAPVRQSSLLPDPDRKAIQRHTGKSLPLADSRYDEEYYFYYIAVTRASEKLVLSRATRDADGSDVAPSPFLAATNRVLPWLTPRLIDAASLPPPGVGGDEGNRKATRVRDASVAEPVLDLRDLDERLARAFWRAGEAEGMGAERPWAEALYEARLAAAPGTSPWARTPRQPRLAELAGKELHLSPTQFEHFARCPFQHFSRHVLRLNEPEMLEFSPIQDGRLLDDVATTCLAEIRERGGLASVESLEALGGALEARLEALLGTDRAWIRSRALWIARLPMLRAALRRFAEALWKQRQEGLWEPDHFQLSFGARKKARLEDPASTRAPLSLELGGLSVSIEGRIDRVDRRLDAPAVARVLDYKRSPEGAIARRYEDATLLQAAVYRLAVAEVFRQHVESSGHFNFRKATLQAFEKPFGKVAQAEGFVLPLPPDAPDDDGTGEPPEPPGDIDGRTRAVLSRLARGISVGDIEVKPAALACSRCPYAGVCRIDTWRHMLSQGAEDAADD